MAVLTLRPPIELGTIAFVKILRKDMSTPAAAEPLDSP